MVEFQVEFLKTLEDGTRLVPDLEKLERVDQFKVDLKPCPDNITRMRSAELVPAPSFFTEDSLLPRRLLPLLCRPF